MKKKLHTVPMKRALVLNSQNKESKHNLEIPVETEFSNLHRWTDGKQRLLFKFSDSITEKEFRTHDLNRISPSTSPTAGKQKTNFHLSLL
jgi:hypothetical protein